MQHTSLASGRWVKLSLAEQMGNIGSEVERSIKWREKGNEKIAQAAFERSAELLELSIEAARDQVGQLRELVRVRECWFDYFVFDNQYQSTAESWRKYFGQFAWLARRRRNKL